LKLKVYLVDVDEFTGQITPEKILECIKKNKIKKIHALITMYHGGYPENIENFYNLKKKFNFFLIEDACHALGSKYKYKNKIYNIGSCKHSDISTFSLHPLKTITTGEGGVVSTNNNKFAKKIELFRSHGIVRNKKYYWKYDVYEYGFNYRISDINCALGLSQLNKINLIIKKRENISNIYINLFKNFNKDLLVPNYSKFIYPSFHLFFLNIKFGKLKKNKDHFINYLVKNKILPQQHYIPINKFNIYKEKQKFFSGAEKFFRNTISIPIYVDLDKSKQMKIINTIKNYFLIN
jgi:dTDP-4-amino-4,6-dideoxygalactose transaminase